MLSAVEQRAQVLAQARAIIETAEREGRGLTESEQRRWDGLMAEAERLRAVARGDDAPRPRVQFREKRLLNLGPEYRAAFARYLVQGNELLGQSDQRALAAGEFPRGGYLIPPTMLAEAQVIMAGVSPLRNLVRTWPLEHEYSLGVPTVDVGDDAVWSPETSIGAEDTSVVFGKRELRPHDLTAFFKVSNKLLQTSLAAEDVVLAVLAEKLAMALERAYLTGDGVQKPLGVFVASSQGISTARDVSVGTGAITYDGLVAMKYALKATYWPRARWVMHRDVAKAIAQIKDTAGQPIWKESTRAGEPDRLLGFPVILSEYAPNTIATGNYVVVLGDWYWYWTAERPTVFVQVLSQLWADQNLTGYLTRGEFDGGPALEEAFVRGKVS
ncbi:phage major capsid protein [Caldinitratiruptor microaerophilus]|uniref:Phage capsid protein n=1 Tax=Caldinitratiruptor microaerophilus TaxID=671077 RepID=A0AA35CP96_9FIRM|nr:phage major capsid protein [Caldinitratiruptor microaerophilus]BDG62334.1 phage capsid protein [Caldinitratiruptor microaerophilus]